MTTDPGQLRQLLITIASGLSMGVLSRAEVAKWCDAIIEREEQPHPFFLELSMLDRERMNQHIRDFLRSDPGPTLVRPLIGWIGAELRAGRLNQRQAIRLLFQLKDQPSATEHERGMMAMLDDGYDLAVEGSWGSLSEIHGQLEELLALYGCYDLASWRSWAELSESSEQ